jgi:hypothetical protein
VSKVLIIDELLEPDALGCRISNHYLEWDQYRAPKVSEWTEIQNYIFATDTTKTSNSRLPWSNKTTIPKLCQIRDNLFSNYMATLFPRRKWMTWVADTEKDGEAEKIKSIESYMGWVVDRNEFYDEVSKLVLDYIDYGNCFAYAEWVDQSHVVEEEARKQVGYVGPVIRRISPLDIVFNPTSPSFKEAPKIVRSIVSLGEVKEILERETISEEDRMQAEELYRYMKDLRKAAGQWDTSAVHKDNIYAVAGFGSFREYLATDFVEILTFYGDIYDEHEDRFLRNQVIKIADRHKVISKKTNSSVFGTAPIYHSGWRIRPDNLWAMGPLDNLVGMQYRIDHLENMKADVFDLIAYPPIKIKGYVDDFNWGPFERIYTGDDGDVELMSPDVQALQADTQIAILEQKMEEMAGSPKEAMGFRSPGEKTMYEVQRLENAASRVYQNKISQFERTMVESCLNAMLELSRRRMASTEIRVFNDDLRINMFEQITPEDIAGIGRIKPIAARNFAERANQIQNLTNFYGSAAGQDPDVAAHFSSIKLAQMWEELLDISNYEIVQPYIRITERADGQRIANTNEESVMMEAQTATGIGTDYDQEDI